MRLSLAIANKDTPEAHRKNAGDIIAIKPYPWEWGRIERREYIIVNVEMPDDFPARRVHRLMIPQHEDGSFEFGSELEEKRVTAKRRFHIPVAVLTGFFQTNHAITIDEKRMQDDNDEYQPVEHIVIGKADIASKDFIRDKHQDAYITNSKTYGDLISDKVKPSAVALGGGRSRG